MKSVVAIFFSFAIWLSLSLAQDDRAVYLEIDAEKVFQGEIYSFRFVAYPAGEEFKRMIETAASGKFINGLKIIKIDNSEFSENNLDAYTLHFDALVQGETIDSLIEIGDNKISFEYKGSAVVPFVELSPNILLRDLMLVKPSRQMIYIFICLIALGLIFIIIKKLLRNRHQKNLIKNKRREWTSRLQEAKSREDYEFLYRHRDELYRILDIVNGDHLSLVATMEELQYKKTLSAEELGRIELEFEKLRTLVK